VFYRPPIKIKRLSCYLKIFFKTFFICENFPFCKKSNMFIREKVRKLLIYIFYKNFFSENRRKYNNNLRIKGRNRR